MPSKKRPNQIPLQLKLAQGQALDQLADRLKLANPKIEGLSMNRNGDIFVVIDNVTDEDNLGIQAEVKIIENERLTGE